MRKAIRNADLATRTARYGLRARPKPYYLVVKPGLHLGYKKPLSGAGKWVVRHSLGEHTYAVQRIATADDHTDADGDRILNFEQAQEKARVSTAHNRVAGEKHTSLTVADVIARYLEFLENSRKSVRDARYRANAFIVPKLGTISVDVLTTDTLRDWISELASAPARLPTRPGQKQRYRQAAYDLETQRRRRATVGRALAVLKAALSFAWRNGLVASKAPWQCVEPLEDVKAAPIRCLTTDEAMRLVNCCKDDIRNLVEAVLQTGARLSELSQLIVGDFNSSAGTVAIGGSKSAKARHIELSDAGREFFSAICARRSGAELIFDKKSKNWQKSHKSRALAQACTRASISPPITFQALRHTYGSLNVMAGVPLATVAKNLGHADTRMAALHYAHLVPPATQEPVREGPGKRPSAQSSRPMSAPE
jgi:integrase